MTCGFKAMIADIDIWRSAAPIIKRYGDGAPLWALFARPAVTGGVS